MLAQLVKLRPCSLNSSSSGFSQTLLSSGYSQLAYLVESGFSQLAYLVELRLFCHLIHLIELWRLGQLHTFSNSGINTNLQPTTQSNVGFSASLVGGFGATHLGSTSTTT
jgi:hypothetical protein